MTGRFARGEGREIGFTTARTPVWMDGVGRGARVVLAGAVSTSRRRKGLREEFPLATVRRDASLSRWWMGAESVRDGRSGAGTRGQRCDGNVGLDLRGRCFSCGWQALRQIPRGETRVTASWAEMGAPKATRAVARRVAERVAVVVLATGGGRKRRLTGYRGGGAEEGAAGADNGLEGLWNAKS